MNQREIAFSNLEIARTRVELDVSYEEHLRIWFDFDRAIPISASQVALAMSTLCGRVFSEISFDFEVEASALDAIRRSTGANVTALVIEDSPLPMLEGGNLLSFSGGFDSFSAWRLMPDDTKLVSLDFGGWFEREAEFSGTLTP